MKGNWQEWSQRKSKPKVRSKWRCPNCLAGPFIGAGIRKHKRECPLLKRSKLIVND